MLQQNLPQNDEETQPINVTTQNLQYFSQKDESLKKIEYLESVIIKRNISSCSKYFCCCSTCQIIKNLFIFYKQGYPKWQIYEPKGNRDPDYDKLLYEIKPQKNLCCSEFKTQINSDKAFLQTNRTESSLCSWCVCCNGPKYDVFLTSLAMRLLGKESKPSECFAGCCQNCWLKGSYLQLYGQNLYWIGNITKCCEYETQSWDDIWNSDRTLRLGRAIYISRLKQRGCCCLILFRQFFKGFCCGFPEQWSKIEFPENATEEDKAAILGMLANRRGQCPCWFNSAVCGCCHCNPIQSCCDPY